MSSTLKILTSLLLTGAIGISIGQNRNYMIHFEQTNLHDKHLLQKPDFVHSGLKPLNMAFTKGSVDGAYSDSTKVYSGFHMILLKKHAVQIEGDDYAIYIDPLFNFEIGIDLADTSGRGTLQDQGGTFYTNTRGIQVQADIGPKVSFYTSFYENQSFFPDYLRYHINSRGEYFWNGFKYVQRASNGEGVVPGQGRAKPFKGTGFDYANANGYVSYSPVKPLNIQFGHGKHFIGHGYRSLLLSDNAFNYPYWSLRSSFLKDKVNYSFIYSYLTNHYRLPEFTTPEATFIPKPGTFKFLSFKPTPTTEIGLFEGTVWQAYDSVGGAGTLPAPGLSYNPIIGINNIFLGLNDSNHNTVIGLNVAQHIKNKVLLYGQIALDDLRTGRFGFQVGGKLFDPFGVKGFTLTAEYNQVSAYTYGHYDKWNNYSHYAGELAHPFGAGFSEIVLYGRYQLKSRFWASAKLNLASRVGEWQVANNGGDIFQDFDDVLEPNGDRSSLMFLSVRTGYRFNVQTNMNAYIGVSYRRFTEEEAHNTAYIFIGLRTCILNWYYDK